MARKPKKKVTFTNHPDDVTPGQVAQWQAAAGEPCKRHSSVHRYVADDQKRCRQCDREAGDKEVAAIVEKIKREQEAAAAVVVPFSFINEQSLADTLGKRDPSDAVPLIRNWEAARKDWYKKHTKAPCTSPCRWKLPDERPSLTHHFEIGDEDKDGISAYIHVGMYPDTYRIGEVFIKASKMGGYVSGFIDSFAIALSLLFQHGVPLRELVEKFSYQSFSPSGFVRGSPPEIKTCKSVVDFVVRWLELRFPGGYLAPEFRSQAIASKAS